jgi:hypothetical protein
MQLKVVIVWDLKLCILRVPEKKVLELSALNSVVFSNSHRVRARTLAKVSGKIIAMTPAVGFITQIMTRCMCLTRFPNTLSLFGTKHDLTISFLTTCAYS